MLNYRVIQYCIAGCYAVWANCYKSAKLCSIVHKNQVAFYCIWDSEFRTFKTATQKFATENYSLELCTVWLRCEDMHSKMFLRMSSPEVTLGVITGYPAILKQHPYKMFAMTYRHLVICKEMSNVVWSEASYSMELCVAG